jgi:PST family polysaccharide transporter/lipopolysaccharide exporter
MAQMLSLVFNLVTMIILARILSPEHIGLFGIGLVFMTFFYSIQDSGIISAVIQRDTRINESISVGFFLRWLIACVTLLAVILVYPFLGGFFQNSAVPQVVLALTVSLFVLTLGFPAQTLLTRALRFSSLAIAAVVQSATFSIVTIAIAVMGFTYWSLVVGSIAGGVAFVLVLIHYESRRFRPTFDYDLTKELFGFGKHLLVVSLMAFVIFSFDQVVIAKVLGIAVLGFYFIAVRIGRTLGDQIAATVNKVIFPTLARIKEDVERLKKGYFQSIRIISIFTAPISMGLSALSPLFVEVVLGPSWLPAAVPLSILSFQGLFSSLITPSSNVLISIGKPKYMSIQATLQAVALVVGIYPATILWGLNGACLLTTALSFAVLIYFLAVFAKLFNESFVSTVRHISPSIISAAIALVVLFSLSQVLPVSIITLVVLIALGAAVYILALHVTSGGRDVKEFLNLVRRTIRPA